MMFVYVRADFGDESKFDLKLSETKYQAVTAASGSAGRPVDSGAGGPSLNLNNDGACCFKLFHTKQGQ
jgi:hypothetical protein